MPSLNPTSAFDATEDGPSLSVTILSGAVAALVVSPLLWLFLRAAEVDPGRALELVASAQTGRILLNSLVLMGGVTLLSVVVGVPLAVMLTRSDIPFRRPLTIIAALPLVVPSYIGAFAFVRTFGEHGEIHDLLGIPMPTIDGLSGTILIITLYTYPYVFLTTRAALLSMDASLVDAARTLNADRLEAFREITVPQIRPAVGAGALLVALYAISDFGTPAFMRVRVFTSSIYWRYEALQVDYAAVLSLQLIAVTAIVLALEAGIGREEETGARSAGAPITLGRWKWVGVGVVVLIGLVTIALPLAIFSAWLLAGTGGTAPAFAFEWEYALNSVYLAALAAIVASAFALPVGYVAARSGRLRDRLFERATYVGFAVPGIVIGLALVFFGSNYAPWIYRTVPLLVFAYVVRFLPQAVGTTRTATLQVNDRLAEAARTLNAGRFETFRRVTWPLIAPGVIAGGALVFLTTMKELPATLMLQPLGMETLVTIIWEAHETAFYRYAAVPAIILVIISGISMLVLLHKEEYGLG